MVELPKTEAELQALIDERVSARETEIKADYDNKFAEQRKKHQTEIEKIKADAGKSAEQLAEERIKEQQDKDANELEELRKFKKTTLIGEKLAKEGLPNFLKNDSRLLNAEDGDLDKVVKDIKKEFEAVQPKGNTHSSVIPQGGASQPNQGGDSKTTAYGKMADALKEAFGK